MGPKGAKGRAATTGVENGLKIVDDGITCECAVWECAIDCGIIGDGAYITCATAGVKDTPATVSSC